MTVPTPLDGERRAILKDEPYTTIEYLEDRAVLRKTYRSRRFLLWRSFLQASRAARECAALRAARDRGVPSIDAVAWGETRRAGCVASSWLETGFVEGCRSMRDLLRAAPAGGNRAARERRRLASHAGRLFGALHRSGILWCTLTPRNVLVQGEVDDGRLLVCDMPSAICYPGSIVGTRRALIDLFDGAARSSRQRELSRGDRFSILLGYTGGDRPHARRLWRVLARRSLSRNKFEKGALKALRCYVMPTLRAPFRRRGVSQSPA